MAEVLQGSAQAECSSLVAGVCVFHYQKKSPELVYFLYLHSMKKFSEASSQG